MSALPEPYYQDDTTTIYCADARDILPLLAPESVDLVLTDPPYGIGLDYGPGVDDRTFLTDWIALCRRVASGPVAFTIPPQRLFDLPERPAWVGVWHKPLTLGFWATPFIPHWEALVFYDVSARRGSVGDVWTHNPARRNGHPTPKPITLWRELLAALPGHGGPVLDPFMGSGTTLRAAKDLGRRSIGIEINEDYCRIAVERLRQSVLPLEAAS